ncbi:MAG: hypothetical protein KGO96_06975 [Elusimicrobia bacterium]|nr:hypothetical protein [Elusimicrobiota bacterium]
MNSSEPSVEQKIKNIIKNIFPEAECINIRLKSFSGICAYFEVHYLSVEFDKLQKLSETFKTKKINFTDISTRSSNYRCDTCGGEETYVEIGITHINI